MKWVSFITIVILFSCGTKKEKPVQPVIRNITESVYATGIIKSQNQYEVFSMTNGILAQRRVREGDIVRTGDVLMILVNGTSSLATENAQLAATYSSLPFNDNKLNQLLADIELSRLKMQNDSSLFNRQRNLWSEGIGTRNELEQKELSYKNSQTTYRTKILQYNELQKDVRFAAEQSFKNLQISRSVNSEYIIKARQNGKVYDLLKEPGEMVNTQTAVAIIGDPDAFLMELRVDEYDIGKIKVGQNVFVTMDSYKGQVFNGTVSRIQPIMDDKSRSFKVEAIFTSIMPSLYPNLTVEANILISSKEHVLTIPRSFLIGDTMVLLSNGEKRKVVTGLKDYQLVEIKEGISKDNFLNKPSE